MTVSELIEKLQKVENKSLMVHIYDTDSGDRHAIGLVDEIDDFCVDLNINEK